jgi:predicted site-specific integrase-resolvase
MPSDTTARLLTVGGLSQETGVPPLTLRRWMRKGQLTAYERDSANRRIFNREKAMKEVAAMLKRNARWYKRSPVDGPSAH